MREGGDLRGELAVRPTIPPDVFVPYYGLIVHADNDRPLLFCWRVPLSIFETPQALPLSLHNPFSVYAIFCAERPKDRIVIESFIKFVRMDGKVFFRRVHDQGPRVIVHVIFHPFVKGRHFGLEGWFLFDSIQL